MSDEYERAWLKAEERLLAVTTILNDLIAELRQRPDPYEVHSGSEHVEVMLKAADRAEAQLKEVQQ